MNAMRQALPLLLLMATACRREPALPVLATVPAFTLTAESGRGFSSQELRGQVWVADLIFTNCPGACLRMSSQLKQVQAQTKDLRLVSFSVDPERDTPEVMAAYAKRFQADPRRWTFLTGSRAELDKVAEGFLLGKIKLDHSTRFILIDREGRVRRFYQSDEPDAVERLLKDAERLQGE